MRQLILAFQFLTIIPLKGYGDLLDEEVGQSSALFPIVGAFQGILAVAAAYFAARYMGGEVAAAAAVLAINASNGGFNLDGLSDTFDAVAVKSGGDRDADIKKRLSVMKDGSTGPIGVTAIVFVLLLKVLFIKGLFFAFPRTAFYSFLFLMPIYSKWAMVPPMYHGRPAGKDGLGKIFVENTVPGALMLSSILAFLSSAAVYLLWLHKAFGSKAAFLLLFILAALYLFGLISEKYCRKLFGGLTGDVFGAVSEISEIIFLAGVTVWLQRFT